MVCRFPPATGFSDFQRNQNCPYFQSSIKLKRPSTTPFSGQIWTISTHLSNSAAEWHRAFIGRHSARNSEQRNARRHRAFIFGVVRLIFERLHAIPKLLNVDFVTANLQLSITAKKSNVCNKPLLYMLNVPWKSLTAAHNQGQGGGQWQSISLNPGLRNWNWSFPPPKTRKSWCYFGTEIAEKCLNRCPKVLYV